VALELAEVVRVPGFAARHGFSTRALGSMGLTGSAEPEAVMARRQRFAQEVGFDLSQAALAAQVHGASVFAFQANGWAGAQTLLETDGLATNQPDQALITYHADCFPILLADRSKGVVAAAHAGWRGTLAGVAGQVVDVLAREYGSRPEDLAVLIGPGICGRCYQVTGEIGEQFRDRYGRAERYLRPDGAGHVRLDLAAANRIQLEDAGVDPIRILDSELCTLEDDRFFSHRGDRPGRFLSAIVAG
jgi:YfiH family protein